MKELAVLELKELSWGDRVALLAWEVSQLPNAITDQDDFCVHHMFRDEWYIREFTMPAGTIFVGRQHLQGHIVKLMRGRVLLALEDTQVEFTAPAVIHTVPGFMTACVMLTEVQVQTWHFNPEGCRDIEELEDQFFAPAAPVLEHGKALYSELKRLTA